MKIWCVGRVDTKEHKHAWELCGVFDNKDSAVALCTTDEHFVGPMELNEHIETRQEWPGGWWPKLEDEPSSEVAK